MSFEPVSGSDFYGQKRIPLGGEKPAREEKSREAEAQEQKSAA